MNTHRLSALRMVPLGFSEFESFIFDDHGMLHELVENVNKTSI